MTETIQANSSSDTFLGDPGFVVVDTVDRTNGTARIVVNYSDRTATQPTTVSGGYSWHGAGNGSAFITRIDNLGPDDVTFSTQFDPMTT